MEPSPYRSPAAETPRTPRLPRAARWLAAVSGVAVALTGVPGLVQISVLLVWFFFEPAASVYPGSVLRELGVSLVLIATGAALAGRYRVAPYLLTCLLGWAVFRNLGNLAPFWPWLALYAVACIVAWWMLGRGHLRALRPASPHGDRTAMR